MNQRTAKLLKKFALHAGKTDNEVKRWWVSLPWNARAGERKKLMRELNLEPAGKEE